MESAHDAGVVKKPLAIAIAGVALVGASVALLMGGTSPARYEGKTTREWALQHYMGGQPAHAEASAALRAMGADAVPDLTRLLREQAPIWKTALWSVARQCPPQVRQRLARKIPPPSASATRAAAARALGTLGTNAAPAVPALAKALRDQDSQVPWQAATALAFVGYPAVPHLLELIRDDNPRVRHAVVYALGQIGPAASNSLPALTERLTDTNQHVRASTAYSLTRMGPPGLFALVDTATAHENHAARDAARTALSRVDHSPDSPALTLMGLAFGEDAAVRASALDALGKLQATNTFILQTLAESLKDPVPEVRLMAMKVLRRSDQAVDSVPIFTLPESTTNPPAVPVTVTNVESATSRAEPVAPQPEPVVAPDTRPLSTNGPAVYAIVITNVSIPATPANPIQPPPVTMTNLVFQRYLPESLNHRIWTNFIANTNGRSVKIWTTRTHPPDWPASPTLVTWNTNSLLWGMRGMTAISPCWSDEGACGQVPITALTKRHGYTRGHHMGGDGFGTRRAGRKIWFVTADNVVIERTVRREIVRTLASPGTGDYTILLFDKDLPDSIQPVRVAAATNVTARYTMRPGAPWPVFKTEQGGNVSADVPPFWVNTWKGGDSGSPNLLPLPGELVFFSGRSTSGPSPAMQADMDELCRLEGLDPKRYQLQWVDLSAYPTY